jgi:invasion protein IalB
MRIYRAVVFVLALTVAAAFAVTAQAQRQAKPSPAAHAQKRKPAATHAAAQTGQAKPKLLQQYGAWGTYTASPGGKKICFAIARPTSAETDPPNRPRDQPYMFITTRPADKVTNEVSINVGYPFKSGSDATAQVGSTTYDLYTQGDGAWIKNLSEESQMVEAMRAGDTAVVKGVSSRGTKTTDTYSLKGLSDALDRVARECK